MTLQEWRRKQVQEAMDDRDDWVDRAASERDATIAAALADYRSKVAAAEKRCQDTVDAVNLGEFDDDCPGDAA